MPSEATMHARSNDRTLLTLTAALATALAACSDYPTATPVADPLAAGQKASKRLACEPDNAGLTLPPGFCVVVVADLLDAGQPARARHMAITPNGDVFVAINQTRTFVPTFGIIGLRDNDGDGRADEQSRFSAGLGGSGIAWGQDLLYFGANDRVQRFPLPAGELMPTGAPEVVVAGLPATGDHISKTVVLDGPHTLFVNIGSATNSCQTPNRTPGVPGTFPCPELPIRAGVWRFDARGTNQVQSDGERWATGVRNGVALAVNPGDGELYGVPHGRDQLFEHWGDPAFFNPNPTGFFYTQKDDALLPSEEFVRLSRGSDTGWPYCYFDDHTEVPEHAQHPEFRGKVLAPEYGGNGDIVSGGRHNIDCASMNQPFVNFGAHWAPNGLMFYTGNQFPARYRGGAFVAFHGGFDRAPFPNEGYQVAFVPFVNGKPTGEWETFADNFAQAPPGAPLPANARHRPVGVTEGPDGSLYVSDDRGGRIFRIIFRGR
jgi:glucose/arabinose dehydrogenase